MMNKIILNYLLKHFIKSFFIIVMIAYCFGIILNLFEEVEFFKNSDVSIFTPLLLTGIFVPSLIINCFLYFLYIKYLVYGKNKK